ncbi:MAG: cell wall hydrolase [Halanaerobiales bacterium]
MYGRETWLAVREFQQKNNLRVDGIVGSSTWRALGYTSDLAVTTLASAGVSHNDDVHLIARLIYTKARGEPYVRQVAVGAVLLNRIVDLVFPNSISGVIYQPLAFESVANGQFDLPPTSENIRAAQADLSQLPLSESTIYNTSKFLMIKLIGLN